jgi:hypothetical protein
MVGSCSREAGFIKTASIGGDTSQGLILMHASSPAKHKSTCYKKY